MEKHGRLIGLFDITFRAPAGQPLVEDGAVDVDQRGGELPENAEHAGETGLQIRLEDSDIVLLKDGEVLGSRKVAKEAELGALVQLLELRLVSLRVASYHRELPLGQGGAVHAAAEVLAEPDLLAEAQTRTPVAGGADTGHAVVEQQLRLQTGRLLQQLAPPAYGARLRYWAGPWQRCGPHLLRHDEMPDAAPTSSDEVGGVANGPGPLSGDVGADDSGAVAAQLPSTSLAEATVDAVEEVATPAGAAESEGGVSEGGSAARQLIDDVFGAVLPNGWVQELPGAPGLRCDLYRYQRHALSWMHWRELGSGWPTEQLLPQEVLDRPLPRAEMDAARAGHDAGAGLAWRWREAVAQAPQLAGFLAACELPQHPQWAQIRTPPAADGSGDRRFADSRRRSKQQQQQQQQQQQGQEWSLWVNPWQGLLRGSCPPPEHGVAGGILADEMGLGKTVYMVALILLRPPPAALRVCSALPADDLPATTAEAASEEADTQMPPPLAAAGESGAAGDAAVGATGRLQGAEGFASPPSPPPPSPPPPSPQQQQQQHRWGGTLIVTPGAIIHQWEAELQRYSDLSVVMYWGLKAMDQERQSAARKARGQRGQRADAAALEHAYDPEGDAEEAIRTLLAADVVLTTYEVLKPEVFYNPAASSGRSRRVERRYAVPESPLTAISWWRFVLDEAQRVGSGMSAVGEMAVRIHAAHRWCVTGTPIGPAGLKDIRGLLLSLKHPILSNPCSIRDPFKCLVAAPYERGEPLGKTRLAQLMKSVMWRNTKATAAQDHSLPPRYLRVVKLRFCEGEWSCYHKVLEQARKARDALAKEETPAEVAASQRSRNAQLKRVQKREQDVLKELGELRRACLHPQLTSYWKSLTGELQLAQGGALGLAEMLSRLMDDAQAKLQLEERKLCGLLNATAVKLLRQLPSCSSSSSSSSRPQPRNGEGHERKAAPNVDGGAEQAEATARNPGGSNRKGKRVRWEMDGAEAVAANGQASPQAEAAEKRVCKDDPDADGAAPPAQPGEQAFFAAKRGGRAGKESNGSQATSDGSPGSPDRAVSGSCSGGVVKASSGGRRGGAGSDDILPQTSSRAGGREGIAEGEAGKAGGGAESGGAGGAAGGNGERGASADAGSGSLRQSCGDADKRACGPGGQAAAEGSPSSRQWPPAGGPSTPVGAKKRPPSSSAAGGSPRKKSSKAASRQELLQKAHSELSMSWKVGEHGIDAARDSNEEEEVLGDISSAIASWKAWQLMQVCTASLLRFTCAALGKEEEAERMQAELDHKVQLVLEAVVGNTRRKQRELDALRRRCAEVEACMVQQQRRWLEARSSVLQLREVVWLEDAVVWAGELARAVRRASDKDRARRRQEASSQGGAAELGESMKEAMQLVEPPLKQQNEAIAAALGAVQTREAVQRLDRLRKHTGPVDAAAAACHFQDRLPEQVLLGAALFCPVHPANMASLAHAYAAFHQGSGTAAAHGTRTALMRTGRLLSKRLELFEKAKGSKELVTAAACAHDLVELLESVKQRKELVRLLKEAEKAQQRLEKAQELELLAEQELHSAGRGGWQDACRYKPVAEKAAKTDAVLRQATQVSMDTCWSLRNDRRFHLNQIQELNPPVADLPTAAEAARQPPPEAAQLPAASDATAGRSPSADAATGAPEAAAAHPPRQGWMAGVCTATGVSKLFKPWATGRCAAPANAVARAACREPERSSARSEATNAAASCASAPASEAAAAEGSAQQQFEEFSRAAQQRVSTLLASGTGNEAGSGAGAAARAQPAPVDDRHRGNRQYCPVCMDPVQYELHMFTCGHRVCSECSRKIMAMKNAANRSECPLCRRAIKASDVFRVPLAPENTGKAWTATVEALDEEEGEGGQDAQQLRRVEVRGCWMTKIHALLARLLLLQSGAPTEKSLVFSRYPDALRLVGKALDVNGICNVLLLSGSQAKRAKQVLKRFHRDEDVRVMLISLFAGADGLTLVRANHVYLLEPATDPAIEQQAVARVHRIGQTRPVYITRLLVRDSVEMLIHNLSESKQQLFETHPDAGDDLDDTGEATALPQAAPRQESLDGLAMRDLVNAALQ